MKLKRTKKGFTIIELVIVIAVIGILAAVLIPTFVNLTNKANEASDNALVNNLNKALKMEEQEPGHKKAETLEGAIIDLEKQGYILENLASKSGKDLLWSQSQNQFLLNTENKSGKDYWKIVDAVPENLDAQKYSYYAGKNFNQTDVPAVKYGFDAGRNNGITKVTYQGTGTAQEVAIRTNGGELEVNAQTDTVNHYNKADSVNIKTVDKDHSFHEYGAAGYAKIANGRFVIEESSEIDGIYLVANQGGEFDGIKLAVVGNAELPSIARADVSLADGQSKLVVEVQSLATSTSVDDNPEYVWISKSGSEVSANVSSSPTDPTAVVTNPSKIASTTKEGTEESATPVSNTSVARINAIGFDSLVEAINNAKVGQTIIMLKDSTSENGYEINKSINLDTNGKTIAVTSGSNVNYRAFKITSGTFKVYGGGIIDAIGAATKDTGTAGTGCYGAFRAEVGTKLELNNLTLKNYRPFGLNVKILGAEALLDNVNIISVCGGGIEVTDDEGADGTIQGYAKLTNCVMSQSNYRDWCSVPVSVSGNSTVDVYASSYTGEYGVYVFSSGGTINIYGGNFTATNNAVLITSYDAKYGNDAIINVYGGTFVGPYSQGSQANTHEFIRVYKGTFDHDPSAFVQEGSHIEEHDGNWIVTK